MIRRNVLFQIPKGRKISFLGGGANFKAPVEGLFGREGAGSVEKALPRRWSMSRDFLQIGDAISYIINN